MSSKFLLLTLIPTICAGTQHPPPEVVEIKTTFLTLIKPCSSSTSSVAPQNTHRVHENEWPDKKKSTTVQVAVYSKSVYTPKVGEVESSSTSHAVVQNTYYAPPTQEIKSTTTQHGVTTEDYTPPAKHETTVQQKHTIVYVPEVKYMQHVTSVSHVVVKETRTTYMNHETAIERKEVVIQTPKIEESKTYSTTEYAVVKETYSKQETTSTSASVEPKSVETPAMKHVTTTAVYTTSSYVPSETKGAEQPPPVKQDTSTTVCTTTSAAHPPPPTHEAIKSTTTVAHSTVSTSQVYTYVAPPPCTCPTAEPEPSATPTYLPTLPLKKDSLEAFSSLIDIILSVPTTILDEDDAEVSKFYSNLSTCVSSKGQTLKDSFLALTPVFEDIGSKIDEGIKDAGVFVGDLISGTLPVVTSAAGKIIKDVVTEGLPATSSAAGEVIKDVAGVPDTVTSAVGPLITNLIPGSFSTVAKRKVPGAPLSISGIFNSLDALRACLSGAIATNPIFQTANCALSIAEVALPASRLLRARRAVEAVDGGKKTILQTLATAKIPSDFAQESGAAVLVVLGEFTGISNAIEDCKFIV